jgi:hypothetical protein
MTEAEIPVMAGLVPAIHVFTLWKKGVDVRREAGHDTANATMARRLSA